MKLDQRKIGLFLIGLSIALLIILVVIKVNNDKEDAYLCDLTASTPNSDMNACPVHTSSTPWLLIVGFSVAFLMLVAGAYLFWAAREEKGETAEREVIVVNRESKEIDASKLDEEEKLVYGILKGNKDPMYQSDLVKESGLSKVKITRILDKLESKHVLERRRRGMTNVIVLK